MSKSAPTVHAHAVVAKPVVKHIVPAVHKTVYGHADPLGKRITTAPTINRYKMDYHESNVQMYDCINADDRAFAPEITTKHKETNICRLHRSTMR